MFEKILPRRKEIDTPKSEHLKEGVRPIIACINESKKCNFFGSVPMPDVPGDAHDNALDVQYGADIYDMRMKKIINNGEETYLISPIDKRNKLSSEYRNCTGLVAVGIAKKDGQNISFLTHQYPIRFLHDSRRAFKHDLSEQLTRLKELSEEKTIDVVIYGGNYFTDNYNFGGYSAAEFVKDYKESIKLLSDVVKKRFGFRPVVITGPNKAGGGQNVFFDTENRRLYVVRPRSEKNSETNKSYHATKNVLKLNEKKWREK